jgi:hypothetical protein
MARPGRMSRPLATGARCDRRKRDTTMPNIFETYADHDENAYALGVDVDQDPVMSEARMLAERLSAEESDWA